MQTMMIEHSPQRSPTPDQSYALQAIQAKNNAGQEPILNLGDHWCDMYKLHSRP